MVCAHIKILAVFEGLVSTTTFLELNHPMYVWFITLLDGVELFSNLVLAIL